MEREVLKKPIGSATKVLYLPLVKRNANDPSTVYSAIKDSIRLTSETGQDFIIFTADQLIYKVVIDIMWNKPDEFPQNKVIARLGGMHWRMSFIECIGSLMSNTGLEDILSKVFVGASKMLCGKLYPENFRALHLLVEVLLEDILPNVSDYDSLINHLESLR